MKIFFFLSLSLLLAVTNFFYAQETIGKEKEYVLKPIAYDSTKTLEEQYKLENQYQFIGLQLFLPTITNAEQGPIVFSKNKSGFDKGNKYYTIIDILQGDAIENLKQKNLIIQCGYRYREFNSLFWKDLIIYTVFVLKENNSNDSLNSPPLYWVVCESKQSPFSWSYFNSFISIPYFEKQKQLYQKQDVIYLKDKSKWFCKEVTLLKSKNNVSQDSTYDIFCLLKNIKGEQIQRRPPSDKFGRSFITEKEYIRLDHANRNQKEQFFKIETGKQEKYKSECISKFGQHYGELIAQNKIENGMSTEMCNIAWGKPWDISTTINSSGTKEIWFYNWKYTLYFENRILVKIEY